MAGRRGRGKFDLEENEVKKRGGGKRDGFQPSASKFRLDERNTHKCIHSIVIFVFWVRFRFDYSST